MWFSIYFLASFAAKQEIKAAEENQDCAACEDKTILFATTTCPNCKMAARFLDMAGISYEKVYADENKALAEEYGIQQAPTLIVVKDGKAEKIVNLSNIRAFTER